MRRKAVVAALGSGLLLRLLLLWRFGHVTGDSLVYGDIAGNLLQHGVYGFTRLIADHFVSPRPTLIRLPGYPLFLAVLFWVFGVGNYTPVMLVQVALDLWTCLLLGGLARRLYGERAGLAALWLAALCPFTANYVAAPLTETPTLFCIAAAFYALLRWRQAGGRWLYVVAAASTWGLLLRPEQGMLAAAVVPCIGWIAFRRRTSPLHWMTPVVLVSVLTLLPLVPWTARNWHTLHVFQPLAPRFANDPGETNPAGFQRWYRTWAIDFSSTDRVYWNYDGLPLSIGDLPNRAFDSQAQYDETARLIDAYNADQTSTPALDSRWNALASERTGTDRFRSYVAMPFGRVFNMAFRPRTEMLPVPLEWWHFDRKHWASALFAWVYAALNLAYFAAAAYGFWLNPRDPIAWSMVALIVMRIALLLTIDNSEMRYTLEFFPVLIVFAAPALSKLSRQRVPSEP